MKTSLVMVVLIMSLACFAQDAKVIALSREDSVQADNLYRAMLDAQKAYAGFQKKIAKTYLLTEEKVPGSHDSASATTAYFTRYREGFDFGAFKFSEDFKFIVPESLKITYGNTMPNCFGTYVNPVTSLPIASW